MQLGGEASLLRTPANSNIARSMQDSAVETLHSLDTWLHEAQGKGYFRSLVKLLYNAGSIASSEIGLEFGRRVAQLWNWTWLAKMFFYQNALSRN